MSRVLAYIWCLMVVGLLSTSESKAQLTEAGINFGFVASRFTLSENKLSEQIFVAQGRLHAGATAGVQIMVGPPKDQNLPYFQVKHGAMLEANLCRCGGNIELTSTLPNGSRSFNELTYVMYMGDYSFKYLAKIKKFRFLIGPTVSNYFFRGVQVGGDSEYRSANNQINDFLIGIEAGIGVRINKFLISTRYHTALTEFGRESSLIPTQYNLHRGKFSISYFFLEKHKGKYWDSIYWD